MIARARRDVLGILGRLPVVPIPADRVSQADGDQMFLELEGAERSLAAPAAATVARLQCGPVIYALTQYLNWPLFTYHPATGRLVWGYEAARTGEGPNMLVVRLDRNDHAIAAALATSP